MVKMAYVDYDNPDTSVGEVDVVQAGYNKIAGGEVGFGNTAERNKRSEDERRNNEKSVCEIITRRLSVKTTKRDKTKCDGSAPFCYAQTIRFMITPSRKGNKTGGKTSKKCYES